MVPIGYSCHEDTLDNLCLSSSRRVKEPPSWEGQMTWISRMSWKCFYKVVAESCDPLGIFWYALVPIVTVNRWFCFWAQQPQTEMEMTITCSGPLGMTIWVIGPGKPCVSLRVRGISNGHWRRERMSTNYDPEINHSIRDGCFPLTSFLHSLKKKCPREPRKGCFLNLWSRYVLHNR